VGDNTIGGNGDAKSVIGPVLGRIPSGVFVLVAGDGEGHTTGMLASWVQQTSFDPPMVTIAVNAARYLVDWLDHCPRIVLHLVGETQGAFLKYFGRGFDPEQPAFDGLETTDGPHGLPILSGTLGHLTGRVTGRFETGDHVLFAVEIDDAAAGPALATEGPMVHVRKNGFNY
jgi:flavin reductase (DIM6/NTAB) family NADH-FMN oxidoreductase RutF